MTRAEEQLLKASETGDLEGVCAALAAGADVNVSAGGFTPLYYAGGYGHDDTIVQLLIDNGANIDFRNAAGNTPLHNAACWGHANMVQLLIDKGAVVNVQNCNGKTPLDFATRYKHPAVVEVLKKAMDSKHKSFTDRVQCDDGPDLPGH